jgi:hypothetical protein
MAEKHGSLLGLHHNEFDETLGHFPRVGGGLDFGHGFFSWWMFFY